MKLEIVESVSSVWFYHLRVVGATQTLCGKNDVMPTKLPLFSWNFKSEHIPEKYCNACERLSIEKTYS